MWTYMMAAARGDRANSMMARRRNESESPKYGYNLSRPMYRTTRLNGPNLSGTSTYPYYAGSSNAALHSTASSSQMFHTYGAAQHHHQHQTHQHAPQSQQRLRLSSGGASAAAHDDDLTSINLSPAGGGGGGGVVPEDDGTSLFSPLTPSSTTAMAVDKDASALRLGSTASSSSAARRKHLIANHVADEDGMAHCSASAALIASDEDNDGGGAFGRRRAVSGRRQHRHDRHVGQRVTHSDREDDEDDEEGDDAEDEEDDDSMSEEPEKKLRQAETDYLENVLENGKGMSQDQSKRTKPSALRRTLNALRQRLTKRNRSKPPDWFLERFSSTNPQPPAVPGEKSSTAAASSVPASADALASEIRGSSPLCNRLSVNPTLQSHYRWLSVVSLAVLYNIIFVVGRSVFWEINNNAAPLWYFLDYVCDFIYLIDTLVHMHEGYLDQGLLVRDAYKLRRHYFSTKGWSIDLVSMLPTDLLYFWWSPFACSATFLPCAVILRLNRLMRLPRLMEWFDRTETATGYPNAFRICKVVLAILVLIHWNACMYFAISYALGFGSDNWVYNLHGYQNSTLHRQYIYSFYWSTLTLTTIGETPTPENDAEYMFVVADFLAGVLIFATIVGNIGSMISNMNVARVEFQNRMDGVKQYMRFRKVGHELEARVIRWFAYTWSQSGALDEERVLAALPDKLKAEIAIQVHMDTLKQVRIFHDCEPGLLEALVLKLKLQVFSPGDYICRKGDVGKEMYIVKRGKLSVVADDGVTVFATLGAGSVFGEVSVLEIAGNRTGNRRTANVRSLGYSDLFCLAKRDLWETLADYPEARAMLTERGCELLRKDGLLDEQVFSDSQRVHDSIEGGIEKLEVSVENLNVRLARLLAEYTASQAKLKQRLAKLELNYQLANTSTTALLAEPPARPRSGRLYSLQPKRRPRPRPLSASKSNDNKQNTL